MPGTTRYSATFDRPYEEDERSVSDPAAINGSRRSRSQSWQANLDTRPYTPLGNNRPSARSSSTDSGGSKGAEHIPTRTVSKTVVKTHNNPFQFVKVGSCPLYKKAEDQLKKVKEVKKPEVLKEEEEEWQTNLDSWKSRRRKMSEDVFRRQEEIRQFEIEEQNTQATQKKTKTFSEMVESRAHRGRTLSLCLISSPLDLQKWELENNNSSQRPYSEGSEENSAVNSEDETALDKRMFSKNLNNVWAAGNGVHAMNNGSANGCKTKANDSGYADSGLESISSSHRTGDTPDSCSDFSQDSGSSIDCDSPRTSGLILNGVNLLESFDSKLLHKSDSTDSFLNGKASSESTPRKEERKEEKAATNGVANLSSVSPNGHAEIEVSSDSSFLKLSENSAESCISQSSGNELDSSDDRHEKQNRSVESENEVFVDDFEELRANIKTIPNNNLESNKASETVGSQEPDTKLPGLPADCPAVSKSSFNSTEAPVDLLDGCKVKSKIESAGQGEVTVLQNSVKNGLSNVQAKVIPESSVEKGKDVEVSVTEPKKIRRKKKKLIPKVSEDTSCQKTSITMNGQESTKSPTVDEASLNIVFQSQSSEKEPVSVGKSAASKEKVVLNDVLPVEKIAEEMEKLILQQLEEEERAKELSNKSLNVFEPPEHNLTAPSKVAEPPKEKPPPPPSVESDTLQKPIALKRINSTKRIKKEIHKRRSNFLGIENADENVACEECLVPPPPALEQILKAEMELDRESRKRLESAATLRLKLEEKEIIEKEREIIATLESEEKQKHSVTNEEICNIMQEEDRIQKLIEERKRMETERNFNETQRLRLEEEKQLREREEYIRKQEESLSPPTELSAPLLSDATNLSKSPNASSVSAETKPNEPLSGTLVGDGKTILSSASQPLDSKGGDVAEKTSIPSKPAVPPKPLKKKEAIRKERERLRQEQEALQREREEHRQKLLQEQDELLKKSHAPAVSRLGPVPPLKPKLTASLSNPPSARETVSFPSQSFHGAQNGISTSNGCVGPVHSHPIKQNKTVSSHKKTVQNDSCFQQKVPMVKKQVQDCVNESKYNQNHWLIQEAEMRRISELKERQHSTQYPIPRTHLAEDAVCSTSPRTPVVSSVFQGASAAQEALWGHGPSGAVMKKVPSSDKPVVAYPKVEQVTQPPTKPSRIVPSERPEHMLSVSGRKRCSHCSEELGRGAAMIIESLQLYYHIQCFQCCVCQAQLGNGSCGTDVRVRNNKLHCHNCYSNDEAGLKFSQV